MPSRLFERVAVRTPPARRAAALPLSIAVHAAAVAGVLAVPVALPVPTAPALTPLASPVVVRADDTGEVPRPRPPIHRVARSGEAHHRVVPADPAGERDRPPVVHDAGPALGGMPVEVPNPDDTPAVCLHDCGGASPEASGDGPSIGGDGGGERGRGAPMRTGGNLTPPRRIHYVAPEYPELARVARVGGTVVLDCTIGSDGRVEDVRLLSGHPLLDDAAVQAVRQWAYTPTRLNGVPVRVLLTVTVRFVPRS